MKLLTIEELLKDEDVMKNVAIFMVTEFAFDNVYVKYHDTIVIQYSDAFAPYDDEYEKDEFYKEYIKFESRFDTINGMKNDNMWEQINDNEFRTKFLLGEYVAKVNAIENTVEINGGRLSYSKYTIHNEDSYFHMMDKLGQFDENNVIR